MRCGIFGDICGDIFGDFSGRHRHYVQTGEVMLDVVTPRLMSGDHGYFFRAVHSQTNTIHSLQQLKEECAICATQESPLEHFASRSLW